MAEPEALGAIVGLGQGGAELQALLELQKRLCPRLLSDNVRHIVDTVCASYINIGITTQQWAFRLLQELHREDRLAVRYKELRFRV